MYWPSTLRFLVDARLVLPVLVTLLREFDMSGGLKTGFKSGAESEGGFVAGGAGFA